MGFPLTIAGREYTNEDFAGRKYVNGWPDLLTSGASLNGRFPNSFSIQDLLIRPYFGVLSVVLPTNLPIGTGHRLKFTGTGTDYFSLHVYSYVPTTGLVTGWVDYTKGRFPEGTTWVVEMNPHQGGLAYFNPFSADNTLLDVQSVARYKLEIGEGIATYEREFGGTGGEIGADWATSATATGVVRSSAVDLSTTTRSGGGIELQVSGSTDGAQARYKMEGGGIPWSSASNKIVDVSMTYTLPTLSDGTNTYTLRIGLATAGATGFSFPSSGGLSVQYTHGTNSGRWVVYYGTSSASTSNTTHTLTTGKHTLRFVIGNNLSTVYVNGVSVFSNAAAIGGLTTPASRITPAISIQKSLGSAARTVKLEGARIMNLY